MVLARCWIGCVLLAACGSAPAAPDVPPRTQGIVREVEARAAPIEGRRPAGPAPGPGGQTPGGAPSAGPRVIDLDGEIAPPHATTSQAGELPADDGPLAPRPSHGELTRVLNPLLEAARRCIEPGPASSALITFRSDGRVERVTVSGPAAGTPAGACIERALGDATVRPFVDRSSTVTIPVRSRK